MRVSLVLTFLLAVTPASAETILFAGNSIAFGTAESLQARLPNDIVVNAGLPNDVSSNWDRFFAMFNAAYPVHRLVLEYGTNDQPLAGLTPQQSLRNLQRMGEYARAHDVRGVYVLTPPPSICKVPLCAVPAAPNYQIVLDRNEHTRVLGHLLTTAAFPPGVVAVDLRDRWHTVVNGWWEHVDAFGLHPTPSGRVPMANWIAEAIETDRAIQR